LYPSLEIYISSIACQLFSSCPALARLLAATGDGTSVVLRSLIFCHSEIIICSSCSTVLRKSRIGRGAASFLLLIGVLAAKRSSRVPLFVPLRQTGSRCRTCTTSECPTDPALHSSAASLAFVPGLAASVITTCFCAARCVAGQLHAFLLAIRDLFSSTPPSCSIPITLHTPSGTMTMAVTVSNLEPYSSHHSKSVAQSLNGLAIW
jgi:hypothetical protein